MLLEPLHKPQRYPGNTPTPPLASRPRPPHLEQRAADGDEDGGQPQQRQLHARANAGRQQHAVRGRPEHVAVHQLPPSFLRQVALQRLQVPVLLPARRSGAKRGVQ